MEIINNTEREYEEVISKKYNYDNFAWPNDALKVIQCLEKAGHYFNKFEVVYEYDKDCMEPTHICTTIDEVLGYLKNRKEEDIDAITFIGSYSGFPINGSINLRGKNVIINYSKELFKGGQPKNGRH